MWICISAACGEQQVRCRTGQIDADERPIHRDTVASLGMPAHPFIFLLTLKLTRIV